MRRAFISADSVPSSARPASSAGTGMLAGAEETGPLSGEEAGGVLGGGPLGGSE